MSTTNVEVQERLEQAQAALSKRIGEGHPISTAVSLMNGLTNLRTLLLTRLHNDFESEFGIDSVLAPATTAAGLREMLHASEEIEAYSLVLVMDEVALKNYAKGDAEWFRNWLLHLHFGDATDSKTADRINVYAALDDDKQRRRLFASALEQALPEARKAPLVIYRIFPRAVRIATAIAFGDMERAREVRAEQVSFLPIIADCHQCHGLPLDNGETCVQCGNPIWKLKWLNATE
jgi:hypothetical protein